MNGDPSPTDFVQPLRAQLLAECQVMIRHALAGGRELPRPILEALDALEHDPEQGQQLPVLAAFYGHLSQLTAPATPSGLRMLQHDEDHHKILHRIGPLPSIRYLMLAAFIFSLMFFGMSLFPEINRVTLAHDIYDMSGSGLLVVLVFLLSAAGLGATFGSLFDAYQYVIESRYETKYDSLYWTRIGLGLVSGLMLSELIPQTKGGDLLERPLLALLGGFSASVVHLVLQRIVQTMESFAEPSRKPDLETAQRTIRSMVAGQDLARRSVPAQSFDQFRQAAKVGDAVGDEAGDARPTMIDLIAEPQHPLPAGATRKRKATAVTKALQPNGAAAAGLS